MADHFVKIKEVPKKDRLKYFWDYYKVHTIVVILLIISAISIIRSTVFRTKEDSYILVAGYGNMISQEMQMNIADFLKNERFDLNGDGKVKHDIQYIMFSDNQNNQSIPVDAEVESVTVMKLNALFTTGNYALQIVDSDMANVLIREGLAAKAEDFGKESFTTDGEYVKIPIEETILKDVFSDKVDKYFIMPRGKDDISYGNDKKIRNYDNSLKLLNMLLSR